MSILLAVVAGALLALTSSVVWVGRVLLRTPTPAPTVDHWEENSRTLDRLQAEILLNRDELEKFRLALSDGIQRVANAEKRIQKTVTSAKRKLDSLGVEHPGLDAEHEALPQADGDAGPQEEMQLVPPTVERSRRTGIPGLDAASLDKIIGA